jgi:Uma2 family endonuclease
VELVRALYHQPVSTEAALDIGQVHRLSTDEYHRLVEAGGFDEDARVELIDGLLADMSPKTREHENAVAWLARRLMVGIDPERYQLRVGSPLTLEGSEPEPDLAVIRHDAPRPYHPATAALVIEVSVSSLQRDLARKPSLYAAAEVDEYWVIDLEGRRAVVHRRPRGHGYAEVAEVGAGGELVPAGLDVPPVRLDDLLRAAAA